MKARQNMSRLKKAFLFSMCVLVGGLLAAYLGLSLWIGSDVNQVAKEAVQRYEGDRVEALMQQVEDEGRTFRERNRAVWALGQLGDPHALPTLKQYETGEPCDHEHDLCQREVTKAVELLEGGLNVTAFVWR